jgi:hypothetical protein
MSTEYVDLLLKMLRQSGFTIDPGLSDDEIAATEATYGFRFPADLRQLLQRGLPASGEFPDWRSGQREVIQARLNWPLDGTLFDIEHNAFWLLEWGQRPTDLGIARQIAAEKIRQAPMLIPIYGHRYLPSEPLLSGNPVFSVYQTDVIYYGFDLAGYFFHEFNIPLLEPAAAMPREIRYWSLITS